ncbi:MAG TPA: alpha/beta hydrolase [candidate division Zixibacteria bacterium]|nr:alpha/beta hydrolase [candidate division Zixibacteria bacterium]
MKNKQSLSALTCLVLGLTIVLSASLVLSQGTPAAAKPSVVLVHGAFADGSGWGHVIPLLEREGYTVTAVQNPLTSFETDVETTKRVVAAQTGPVVLVGHSYGGAVITAASVGATNIKALVYVAAFGPDSGEALGPLLEKYPSLIGASLVPDAAGYLYIDRAKFNEAFAKDVNPTEQRVMAATQKPINSVIFGQVFGAPGWKNIPSWYLVATQDNAINPELQRMFANRMKAKTTEVAASHVPFISKPEAVAKMILEAANSK